MRISRSKQLYPSSGTVHMFWRCHNKEFYLSSDRNKNLYLETIKQTLLKKEISERIKIHAYCVMGNHFHQSTTYLEQSKSLSDYMRVVHGRFGQAYNRLHFRSGKVAESRPKTSLIQNEIHEMRVQFYIEANPIRARICKLENLKFYRYSSFRYYAFGIRDEFTKFIDPPVWYTKLGKNPIQRQKKYLELFIEYLSDEELLIKFKNLCSQLYIGEFDWVKSQVFNCKMKINAYGANTS